MTTPNYSVDEPTPNLGLIFCFLDTYIHKEERNGFQHKDTHNSTEKPPLTFINNTCIFFKGITCVYEMIYEMNM